MIVTISILCKNCHGFSLKRPINNQNTGISPRQQFMMTVMLSILFRLGWGIGLLVTEKLNSTYVRYMFSTLFVIVTSFHGLLIFILHCARSKEAREVWAKWFFRASKRNFSDLTSSALDHFYHHRKTNPSQLPFPISTSLTTKMLDLPSSMACPSSLTTTDSGTLEFFSMKQCQLAKDLDQNTTEGGTCEKSMEAEMETEVAKVALAKTEPQHASPSTLNSAASSSDQNTRALPKESVVVIVHVPDDITLEPKDSILCIQVSSMSSTEMINPESSQPATTYERQTMEDKETEKVQELQLASLDKAEKNAGKDIQKSKELDIEGGNQCSEEVKCDEVKINGFNGDEVPNTSMILEGVKSDQDQATPVQDDD